MPIPSEIQAVVDRLNQEIDETEQVASEGVNIVRQLLSLFPDNAIIIQYFAALTNFLFFADNSRRRIQTILDSLAPPDVPAEDIQESGEYLATLLGEVLEAKIRVGRLLEQLENLL